MDETSPLSKAATDPSLGHEVVDLAGGRVAHGHRHGLRKLSPDLIGKASEDAAAQVNRIGLTFLGTAAFCILSLFSPDSALLGSSEKINVPLAGPVSFFGFMLLGPLVLIVLRVYLQIYVEHSGRLDRLARWMLVALPPAVPLKNPLIRVFNGFVFYLLLPVTMLLFAWKAAVFPLWGSGLLCVAAGVIASHAMLPLHRTSWRLRALLSVMTAVATAGVILGFGVVVQSSASSRVTVDDFKALNLGPLRLQLIPVARTAMVEFKELNLKLPIGREASTLMLFRSSL